MTTGVKMLLNCDSIDGYFLKGFKEPIVYCFTSDKLPGLKFFLEPVTLR